jgi:hypothetical protein
MDVLDDGIIGIVERLVCKGSRWGVAGIPWEEL